MKRFSHEAIPDGTLPDCVAEPLELTPGDIRESIDRFIRQTQSSFQWVPRSYCFFVPESLLLHRPKPKYYRFWFKSSRLKWMKRRNWLAESLRKMGAMSNQRLKDAP